MSVAFGKRVRQLREYRGLSQRDFAERVGVDFTYISKIEHGAMAAPSEDVIRKMADTLNEFPDDLIELSAKAPLDWGDVLEDNPRLVKLLRRLASRRYSTTEYEYMLRIATTV